MTASSATVTRRLTVALLACWLFVTAGCATDNASTAEQRVDPEGGTQDSTVAPTGDGETDVASLFDPGALSADIEIVDCALENGSDARCYQLLASSQPGGVGVTGPFCPASLTDEHGMFTWDGENPGLYALDEAFWAMLKDQGYSFVTADGTVNVADPADPVSGAPGGDDVCLQATADGSYTLQMLLPVTPERLETVTTLDTVAQVGVALDGATIFGDAPSGTTGAIPALDPCGGHNDPSGYYHWHFGADSVQTNLDSEGVELACQHRQDTEALVGFAFDGFAIHGLTENGTPPGDLDECSGHVAATVPFGETYHYHLTSASPNLPTCRVGAVAVDKLTSPDNPNAQLPDGGGPGGRPGG
jgi:hypothetical protein